MSWTFEDQKSRYWAMQHLEDALNKLRDMKIGSAYQLNLDKLFHTALYAMNWAYKELADTYPAKRAVEEWAMSLYNCGQTEEEWDTRERVDLEFDQNVRPFFVEAQRMLKEVTRVENKHGLVSITFALPDGKTHIQETAGHMDCAPTPEQLEIETWINALVWWQAHTMPEVEPPDAA